MYTPSTSSKVATRKISREKLGTSSLSEPLPPLRSGLFQAGGRDELKPDPNRFVILIQADLNWWSPVVKHATATFLHRPSAVAALSDCWLRLLQQSAALMSWSVVVVVGSCSVPLGSGRDNSNINSGQFVSYTRFYIALRLCFCTFLVLPFAFASRRPLLMMFVLLLYVFTFNFLLSFSTTPRWLVGSYNFCSGVCRGAATGH